MEEGDGSSVNGVGLGDEGTATLASTGGEHAKLEDELDELFEVLEPDWV